MRRLQAIILTVLLATSGVLLAPASPAFAGSIEDQAVGVEWGNSPDDPTPDARNGVAMNTVPPNSGLPIFVKHVRSPSPLCAEVIGFYSTSQQVPAKKDLPVGVDRGFTRFASEPYEGTPIVYIHGKANNAVFSSFVKGKTIITDPVAASNLTKDQLQGGTLYIVHYNMVGNGKDRQFKREFIGKDGVTAIYLMKNIDFCPFKK